MKVRALFFNRDGLLSKSEFADSANTLWSQPITSILNSPVIRSVEVHFHDGSSYLVTQERA